MIYTPFEYKCIEYNINQTEVGSPLKTLKGSTVKRYYKYGLGKIMVNRLYFHKCYVKRILTDPKAYRLFLDADAKIDFDYNIIRWDPNSMSLALEEVPDFDIAREPVVGRVLSATEDNIESSGRFFTQILHHKWTMVDNNYVEFDVKESWEWSRAWLCLLKEKADGSSEKAWNAQLQKLNISKP